jgi:hypothetical protein
VVTVRGERLPRRWTDRIEDATAWAVTALGLLALVVGLVLGAQTYASRSEQGRAEAAERKPAEAVLLQAANEAPSPSGWSPPERVLATWVDAHGQERTGEITAQPPLPAGARVSIWVDAEGRPVSAPGDRSAALTSAAIVGGTVLLWAVIVLWGIWIATRRVLDARNAEAWASEWAVVEPRWSGRRPTTPGSSQTTDS